MKRILVASIGTALGLVSSGPVFSGSGAAPVLPSPPPAAVPIGPAPTLPPTTSVTITNGPRGDVHDGQLLFWQGRYYLIGTAYSGSGCYFSLGSPTSQWCGFHAYTSTDLQTWRDAGTVFDPAPWQSRCAAPNYGCFRPHELYNQADGRWVLWANIDDTPTQPLDAGVQAWTGPTPAGPFIDAGKPHLSVALGQAHYGDLSLFLDDDGSGYAVYTVIGSDGAHDLAVERLDEHYLAGTGQAVHLSQKSGFNMVEAPAIFKQGGTYHLLYSDPICAYCTATGTGWATATNPLGPWTKQGDLSKTSCGGQPSAVTVLPSGEALYQSDQWLGTPNESQALQHWEVLSSDGSGLLRPLGCANSFTLTIR